MRLTLHCGAVCRRRPPRARRPATSGPRRPSPDRERSSRWCAALLSFAVGAGTACTRTHVHTAAGMVRSVLAVCAGAVRERGAQDGQGQDRRAGNMAGGQPGVQLATGASMGTRMIERGPLVCGCAPRSARTRRAAWSKSTRASTRCSSSSGSGAGRPRSRSRSRTTTRWCALSPWSPLLVLLSPQIRVLRATRASWPDDHGVCCSASHVRRTSWRAKRRRRGCPPTSCATPVARRYRRAPRPCLPSAQRPRARSTRSPGT